MTDLFHREPIADSPISVVLLAHNVGKFVQKYVKKWRKTLESLDRDYQILIVDDGSTDDTAAQVEELATKNEDLVLLNHEIWEGVGRALKTGVAAAKHPLVCYCLCDEAYAPKELKSYLKDIDKVDLVIGVRRAYPIPQWLWTAGVFYRVLVRVLLYWNSRPREGWLGWGAYWRSWWAWWYFGSTLEDVGCPYRLYRKEALEKLIVQSAGEFVHVELLAKGTFRTQLVSVKPIQYKVQEGRVPDFQKPYRWSDFWKVLNKPKFLPTFSEPPESPQEPLATADVPTSSTPVAPPLENPADS